MIAASLAALLASAAAADPVLGDGPPRGTPLSLAQLRACLDLQDRLESQGEAMQTLQSELDAARADFQRFDAALQAERAALDSTHKPAVAACTARRQDWIAGCDDRPYDEDDCAASLSGR